MLFAKFLLLKRISIFDVFGCFIITFITICHLWMTICMEHGQFHHSPICKLSVDKTEVEGLLQHFKSAREEKKKKMDRTRFRMVLHNSFNITDDIMMDRGW